MSILTDNSKFSQKFTEQKEKNDAIYGEIVAIGQEEAKKVIDEAQKIHNSGIRQALIAGEAYSLVHRGIEEVKKRVSTIDSAGSPIANLSLASVAKHFYSNQGLKGEIEQILLQGTNFSEEETW